MNDLLTIREVAQALRVDDTTVRRWVKQGLLEAVTLPHKGKPEDGSARMFSGEIPEVVWKVAA